MLAGCIAYALSASSGDWRESCPVWSRSNVFRSVTKKETIVMSEFVFLYRGGERPESPELGQQVLQKWMAWFKTLADQGHLVERGAGRNVTDGPFAEAKDVVGGYTLIKARDVAEAAELAKGCPILDYGGRVEVRPVMKFDM
jgi:hypothetical protein